jgi:hypothetical protein
VGAASESNEREEYKGEVDDVCTWEEKTKEENKRRGSSEVEGGQDDSRCRMTVHDAGTGVWTWATAVNEVRSVDPSFFTMLGCPGCTRPPPICGVVTCNGPLHWMRQVATSFLSTLTASREFQLQIKAHEM